MTRKEFETLTIGDIIKVKRGFNQTKLGKIALIHGDYIVVESVNGDDFYNKYSCGGSFRPILLNKYAEFDLVKES